MKNLYVKAFAGLLNLVVIVAVVLFLSAGTINYWQAWVFLAVFFGGVLAITIYLMRNDPRLLERRVQAGPVAEKTKCQRIIQSLASLAFLGVFIVPGLDHRFGWSRASLFAILVGDLLVGLGLLFVFFVFRENTYTSAVIEVGAEQKVISSGPYALVRHPMYSGALVMLLGVPLALGSYWGLLMVIPIALVIVWRLMDEVQYGLNTNYGTTKTFPEFSYVHSINLGGLIPDARYHFRVTAVDPYSNRTQSRDIPFQMVSQTSIAKRNINVAIVIDSSGSMVDSDPQNMRLTAAKVFIDNMEVNDRVAIVDFDDLARTAWDLQTVGSNRTGARAAVDTIDSAGGTNIGAGLQAAYNILSSDSSENPKAAILLTDGQGGYAGEADAFADRGWKIYTVGLGSAVDSTELSNIASVTGGQYYHLLDPTQLIQIYSKILCTASGAILMTSPIVHLSTGETKSGLFSVPASQTSLSVTVNWPGSTVKVTLVDPSGQVIFPDSGEINPLIYHANGATYDVYQIQYPQSGTWKWVLYGAVLPPGGEPVSVQMNMRGEKSAYLPSILKGTGIDPSPVLDPWLIYTSPANHSRDQGPNVLLSWSGFSPDGSSLVYNVYLEAGDDTPDVLAASSTSSTVLHPSSLATSTDYFWQIVARDSQGRQTEGPVWKFTTLESPGVPYPTFPLINVQGVNTAVQLSWKVTNSDTSGYTYDVLLSPGDVMPNSKICQGITSQACNAGSLALDTIYSWKVIAYSPEGLSTTSPIFRFHTIVPNAGWSEVGFGSASGSGISKTQANSALMDIAVTEDGTPYVAWIEGNFYVYIRRYNGSSWVEVSPGSATGVGMCGSGTCSRPSLAVGPNNSLFLSYIALSSPRRIVVKKWTGSTWIDYGSISDNSPQTANIAVSQDGAVYVTWDGNTGEIYTASWNSTNSSWVPLGTGSMTGGGISSTAGSSYIPVIQVRGNDSPYIAWVDSTNGNPEIYVRHLVGSTWVEVGSGSASYGGISNTPGSSTNLTMAITSSGVPYIAWQESVAGANCVYIRFWDGSGWVEVGAGSAGGSGISGNAAEPVLTVDSSDKVYLAWRSEDIYIKRWYGTAWEEFMFGSARDSGISGNPASVSMNPAATAGANGLVYVAWRDNEGGNFETFIRKSPPE